MEYVGFSLWWLLCCRAWALGHVGFSSCGSQALEHSSVVVMHGFSCPLHEESSATRDQIHVLCISRWICNHWTTRKVQLLWFQLPPNPDYLLLSLEFQVMILKILHGCTRPIFILEVLSRNWYNNIVKTYDSGKTKGPNHISGQLNRNLLLLIFVEAEFMVWNLWFVLVFQVTLCSLGICQLSG